MNAANMAILKNVRIIASTHKPLRQIIADSEECLNEKGVCGVRKPIHHWFEDGHAAGLLPWAAMIFPNAAFLSSAIEQMGVCVGSKILDERIVDIANTRQI